MKLREIVKQHREAFDQVEEVPFDSMWVGIDHRLRSRARRRRLIWRSAAAVLIIGIAVPWILTSGDPEPELSQAQMQLQQYEHEYARKATDREQTLDTDILPADVRQEIEGELAELDAMYNELKIEITNVPNAEQLIETAIRFHERRLRILSLLEKEIENQKRNQRQNEEIKI